MLFANHGKTDSRVALEFSPSIVDVHSIMWRLRPIRGLLCNTISNPRVLAMICFTLSIHFVSFTILPFQSGVNTIIEPLPQPLCTDRIARFVSVTSKLTFMVLPVLLVLPRCPTHTFLSATAKVGLGMKSVTTKLGGTCPETRGCRCHVEQVQRNSSFRHGLAQE